MRVLLTNDDGIGSPGLIAVLEALAPVAETVVIAPAQNQSAVARSITLRRAMTVTEYDLHGAAAAFAVDGTPVDCVRFAALGLGGGGYDAVVSGANLGHNLGDDVTYSGTVAAALEGVLLGLPAIAVSQGALDGGLGFVADAGFEFGDGARFTARLLQTVFEHGLPPGLLLNVNVPAAPAGRAHRGTGPPHLPRQPQRDRGPRAREGLPHLRRRAHLRRAAGQRLRDGRRRADRRHAAALRSRRPQGRRLAVRPRSRSAAVSDEALRIGAASISRADLDGLVGALARDLHQGRRIAVVADVSIEAVVLILAGLAAGCEVVLLNPKSGPAERAHILADARPELVLTGTNLASADRAPALAGVAGGALVIYTSGTTGPPKGVVLPVAALHANLAAVYDAWAWTAADRVVHALPLYHVHGLLLGTLGPLWRGGSAHHVGRFEPRAIADALQGGRQHGVRRAHDVESHRRGLRGGRVARGAVRPPRASSCPARRACRCRCTSVSSGSWDGA